MLPMINTLMHSQRAFKIASQAVIAKNTEIKTLSLLGEQVVDNSHLFDFEREGGVFGFHATIITEKLMSQIEQGMFNHEGKDLFIELSLNSKRSKKTIERYAISDTDTQDNSKKYSNSLILNVGTHAGVGKCDRFEKWYIHGNTQERTHIIGAYRINQACATELNKGIHVVAREMLKLFVETYKVALKAEKSKAV